MPSTTAAPKSTTRKTRARKTATTPKTPAKARVKKAAAKPAPAPVIITPDAPSVKANYAKTELKSLKDYPRDGLALILLPVLYLEALVKELLPLVGKIKLG